jgi:formylglycine-generating enzyme required for sulfatase activity
MLGSVSEWVADHYDEKFYARSPAIDPRNEAGNQGHVHRGSSYLDLDYDVRVSRRGWGGHDGYTSYQIGFRCASDSGPQS